MKPLRQFEQAFAARPPSNRWEQGWRAAVELQVVLLLMVAPLFFGGRYEGGRAVFVSLACALAITIAARLVFVPGVVWSRSGVEPLLLAAALLLTGQLVEWPADWLRFFSPTVGGSLPLWQASAAGASFGEWRTISLMPAATRESLVVYLGYAALFLALVQHLKKQEDAERLARWVAVSAAAMATLGLVQFFSGTSAYLWLYEHPGRSPQGRVTGCFTNQNHFAQFVVLGMGPLLWCVHQARRVGGRHRAGRREERGSLFLVPWFGAGLVVLAVLLSLSRGGMLALAVSIGVYAAVMLRHGQLRRRELATIGLGVVCIAAAVALHGYEPLARRLASLVSTGGDLGGPSRERFDLWRADWEAVGHFSLVGAGAGTHPDIYPRYMVDQYNVRFTHAENCYLQVMLETGVAGFCLLVTGVVVALTWCATLLWKPRPRTDVGLAAALCGSVAATLVHAAVDFAWYLPGCMTMTLAVLAALWRTALDAHAVPAAPLPAWTVSRRWAVAGLVTVTALGAMLAGHTSRTARAAVAWDGYLRRAYATSQAILHNNDEALSSVSELIELADKTLRCNPEHAQAWLRLAALQMRRFDLEQMNAENAMDLAQLRDAVMASRFPTNAAAREWLTVAIGDNLRHLDRAAECARRAARLAPWRGEAYLYLAELSFLWSGEPESRRQLLAQASQVRPHDGSVLFARGLVDLQEGRSDQAFSTWREMFGRNRELREKLVDLLAPQLGPAMFVVAFSPDRDSLLRMFRLFQSTGRKDEASFIGQRLLPQLRQEVISVAHDQRGLVYGQMSDVAWYLGERDAALESLQQALDARPHDFGLHRLLAQRAAAAEQFDLAATQLRWCLQRTPFDPKLKEELARVEKRRRSRFAGGAADGTVPSRR